MQLTFFKIWDLLKRQFASYRALDHIKFNQGLILAELYRTKSSHLLRDFEFKVFSQGGDDGILQRLTNNLTITHKTFIEFGIEDFSESNCRFLMTKDFWRGFVIDGSEKNISKLRGSDFCWRYPLQSRAAFITRENVASLLEESGFDKDLGILSIDVDGVDYFILEALAAWRPRILITEYNGVFGNIRAVTIPYDANFQRRHAHYSNVYYGASLPAFAHLAHGRGYALVGTNGMGNNAYFVRRDLLNNVIREVPVETTFRDSCFRESRNEKGVLTLRSGKDRRIQIGKMPLIDVITGEQLTVSDLP